MKYKEHGLWQGILHWKWHIAISLGQISAALQSDFNYMDKWIYLKAVSIP